MKNILYIVLIVILITACTKEKEWDDGSESHTVAGRIVSNCALTPLTNTPMRLFVQVSTAGGSDIEIYDFSSDANGYFSYTFNKKYGAYTTDLRFGSSGIYPDGPNEHAMGTIIAKPIANFVVKLKVNNVYNTGDTLFIRDFSNSSNVKISAPLTDTVFNVTTNHSSLGYPTLISKNTVKIKSSYIIYNGMQNTSSYNELNDEFYEKIIPGCTGMVDTVVVEIN